MPAPLIPVVLIGIGVVTGSGGVGLGVKGGYHLKKANRRIREAGERYEAERLVLEGHEAATNERLRDLGSAQESAILVVVERMADFLRRHEKVVSASERLLVDGLDTGPGSVAFDGGLGQDAVSWMRGIVGSAVAGVGINAGVTGAVTSFAAASTGTAISTLSGAAATNASLAFLGGGSLAAGGGGMALGATALSVVSIGPAILVSGFVVAGQGEKAKTKAAENEAAVNVAIADLRETKMRFDAIVARADELDGLLGDLVVRATTALDVLESEPFVPDRHAARFQRALTLAVAVRDVAAARIVDDAGDLADESATVAVRYRPLIKEPDDA